MTPRSLPSCWSIKNRKLDPRSRRGLSAWVADAQNGLASSAVILSTCERVEAYSVDDLPSPPVPTAALWRSGNCAIEHLVRVASGLDSQLVGETEIRGQIRAALDQAANRGRLDPMIIRIFRSALRAGARVRAESGLDRICTSYARLAARRAIEAGPRIGVVGTGAMARSALLALPRASDARLMVFGRHPQRTRTVAARINAEACSMDDLIAKAVTLDSLLTCVASSEAIVNAKHVRRARSLLVIDLGIPANVDPSARIRSNVEYVDLDSLAHGVDSPRRLFEQAELIVARETDQLAVALSRAHLLPPPRPWRPRSTAAPLRVA